MKYISIIGFDRSGTTFIGNLLSVIGKKNLYAGEIEEGVLKYLNNNIKLCSCGEMYPSCPVWGKVLPDVDQPIDIDKIAKGLIAHSGTDVIIDTSKSLEHVMKCHKTFGDDHILIFIKRNPKGVVASRMKMRKERVIRGTHPRPNIVKRYNLMMIYDSISWTYRNFKFEMFLKSKNSLRLNYDLLNANSITEIEHYIAEHNISLGENEIQNHIIWGANKTRMNFDKKISVNMSWQSELSFFQKLVVDIITFPVRLLFGYKFNRE